MKKLYIILGCVAASLGVVAQNTSIHKNPSKKVFSKSEISPRVVGHQELVSQPIGGGNRTVLLSEDFQGITLSNTPAAIPTGWSTVAAATATAGQTTPAFKIYNSSLANAGGYWPVPQVGTNNKFAGANDDPAPCDCDFLDVWLQTPSLTLTDYEYTTNPVEVWGIVTSEVVTDIWTDFQDLGNSNIFSTTIPADPNGTVLWNEIGLVFDAAPAALPLTVTLNGTPFLVNAPGTIDVSAFGIGGDLVVEITSADGIEIISNVVIDALGTYETGEVITDTIPANQGDAGAEVIDIIDVLDSTFVGNYTLGFDFFHDANFGGGDATVQISTDGGATWSILDTLTIDEAYWQSLVLPLYNYNGMTVSIRFQWSDNSSWASGFAVDNIVVQNALLNDISVAKTIASDWNNPTFGFGFWEYSNVPLSQVSPVRATSVVYNAGFNNQLGVGMNYDIDFNGTAQGSFASGNLDVISLDKDTLSGVSTFTPSALGTVTITGTVAAADGMDDNMNNNVSTASMEITQNIYARDLGAAQAFVGPTAAYEYGNLFDIYANDEFGAIDVCVRLSSGTTSSTIQGRLYEFTELDAATGEPILVDLGVQTVEYTVTDVDNTSAGGAVWINLAFEEPVTLEADKIYFAAVVSDGTVGIPVSGTNDWVVSWLNDGTWGATGGIPMIRLNSDESLSISEKKTSSLVLSQNMPNPATDETQVNYQLASASTVQMIVRDVTGREVMSINEGIKPAGAHSVRFNVNELGAGIYTYTLTAGDVHMTKEMIVK